MPNWRRGSTPRTSGSCSAPAFGSAISPPKASSPRIWRSMPRSAALADAGIDAQSIDLIVLATSTPDNTFPATAVAVQNGARHQSWRGLRPAGGLLGLRLRAGHRRQFPAHRRVQARAGDRRRNLFANPGLERPRHLRAVRRRRRRRRAGSAGAAGQALRPRHPDHASTLRRPAQGEAICRWRAVLDADRSAISGWKAAKCSSTRSA